MYEEELFFNTVMSIVVCLKSVSVVGDFKSTNTVGLIAVFELEGNGIGVGQTHCWTSLTVSVQFATMLCIASKG